MATNFPTSLDNLTNPAGSDPVNNPSHASQHANLNDAIEKLEEKVGVNNSAVTTSLDYRVKQLETNPVASYTDEEARNAIGTALTGSGGITVTPNNVANTITLSTDSTIATKTYVDTAVSNLGSTAASTYVLDSSVGNADGVASLDATGQVPFSQLGNIVNSAPATLNTLNELATALGNDANFATTTATSIGNKVSKAGGDIITSSLPSVVGLTIKGASSQTANLQEWQLPDATTVASIAATTTGGSTNGVLKLLGAYGGIASNGEWSILRNGGELQLYAPVDYLIRSIYGGTVKVRGHVSQTANLQEWQNSAGTVLSAINSSGNLSIGRGSTLGAAAFTIQSVTPMSLYSGDNTTALHNRIVYLRGNSGGNVMSIASKGDTAHGVGALVITNGAFTSELVGFGYNGNIYANLQSASTIGLIVKGAASQTANLQEWQNSSGTVLAKVDSTGAMFTITPAANTNTTQVATTAFVQSEIDANVQPGALYQTSAPSSPAVGQIWIDSDEDVTTFDSNIIRRKAITATAGQTVFTADLPFIDGFEQIFMNGLLLVKTTDYATSGGNTVTLTSAAAASDVIEIVSVTGANSVDTYTQAETNALLAANTSVAPLSISANTTLVAKKRYFVTSASALTLTLPASPALNDEIQILDASGNSSTYNITVARNANKINGGNNNLIIDTNGGWYTLLYTGSTYGWKVG